MVKQHIKIDQLKLRAAPVTMSGSYVDAAGNLQMMDFKIEVREADRVVKGYLIVWGVRDTYGTAFVKGCCAKSIRERGPESASKQKIAHLWQHDICDPIGQYTVLKEDDYGLYFEAAYDDIEQANRALRQIRSGTLNQFSVGFDYIYEQIEYDDLTDTIWLKEIKLMEGSVVTFGSNEETYAFRSADKLLEDKQTLIEDTDYFISQLPKSKQLEYRQLIKRHISLASVQPGKDPLDQVRKPKNDTVSVGGYNLNVNEFKN